MLQVEFVHRLGSAEKFGSIFGYIWYSFLLDSNEINITNGTKYFINKTTTAVFSSTSEVFKQSGR